MWSMLVHLKVRMRHRFVLVWIQLLLGDCMDGSLVDADLYYLGGHLLDC